MSICYHSIKETLLIPFAYANCRANIKEDPITKEDPLLFLLKCNMYQHHINE